MPPVLAGMGVQVAIAVPPPAPVEPPAGVPPPALVVPPVGAELPVVPPVRLLLLDEVVPPPDVVLLLDEDVPPVRLLLDEDVPPLLPVSPPVRLLLLLLDEDVPPLLPVSPPDELPESPPVEVFRPPLDPPDESLLAAGRQLVVPRASIPAKQSVTRPWPAPRRTRPKFSLSIICALSCHQVARGEL